MNYPGHQVGCGRLLNIASVGLKRFIGKTKQILNHSVETAYICFLSGDNSPKQIQNIFIVAAPCYINLGGKIPKTWSLGIFQCCCLCQEAITKNNNMIICFVGYSPTIVVCFYHIQLFSRSPVYQTILVSTPQKTFDIIFYKRATILNRFGQTIKTQFQKLFM